MIQVQAPGLLTTVQDLGREGFGPLGVSPSGAADALALRIGNRLAGNRETAAALEMTLLGGSFRFDATTTVAVTGSDFQAALDGEPVPLWTSRAIRPGQTLRFGPTRSGARCYLAVSGGIAVTLFLGSASTHILSGLGGWEGRALRRGDILPLGTPQPAFQTLCAQPEILARLAPRKTLRVTRGLQWEWFREESRRALLGSTYEVTEESNRMGLRLRGAAIESSAAGQMITEGVPLGAIQVPGAGQPIILFVEQQTTGGYPKIANIIAADLASVGQLRPRDEISFELVPAAEALRLLRQQEDDMCHIIVADEQSSHF